MRKTIVLLLLLALWLAVPAIGADVFWNGGTGNWESPANWSTGQVPGANDRVFIDNGSVTLSSNVSVRKINVEYGGRLGIQANSTIDFTYADPNDAPFIVVYGELDNEGAINIIYSPSNGYAQISVYGGLFNNYSVLLIYGGDQKSLYIGNSPSQQSSTVNNYGDIAIYGLSAQQHTGIWNADVLLNEGYIYRRYN